MALNYRMPFHQMRVVWFLTTAVISLCWLWRATQGYAQSDTREFDIDSFIKGYVGDQNITDIPAFMRFLTKSHVTKDRVNMQLVMFIMCATHAAEASQQEEVRRSVDSLPSPAKEVYRATLASPPDKYLATKAESPSKNDLYWSCFFGSGDRKYLTALMEHALKDDERKDLNVYTVAASAKWSLCANSKSVTEVQSFIRSLAVSERSSKRMKTLARELIDCSPQALRESIPAVLKEQKDKGVWR